MKTTTSLAYDIPGKFEETRFEKNHNVIFENSAEASKTVAQEIAELIRLKQAANESCVLGLATGSSPIKVYEELVRMHKEEGLSFSNVITFNLDEYYPMTK
ncbi:glucosamine-6-phosphate deaminase, partial [Flavobacterium sp. 3-210]